MVPKCRFACTRKLLKVSHKRLDMTTPRASDATDLPPLPPSMARWRVEKLPVLELKQRLHSLGLSEVGTKRVLAKRLHDHLVNHLAIAEEDGEDGGASVSGSSGATSDGDAGSGNDDASSADEDDGASTDDDRRPEGHRGKRRRRRSPTTRTRSGGATRRDRRDRHSVSPAPLSARQLRAVKQVYIGGHVGGLARGVDTDANPTRGVDAAVPARTAPADGLTIAGSVRAAAITGATAADVPSAAPPSSMPRCHPSRTKSRVGSDEVSLLICPHYYKLISPRPAAVTRRGPIRTPNPRTTQ